MQVIAEYFGAHLQKVENQVNIKHTLIVNKSTKHFNKLNQINSVNSFHTYGIKNLSDDFLISATNQEGMIKAIEHTEYNIFGQMWHSEREEPFCTEELNFIKSFFLENSPKDKND